MATLVLDIETIGEAWDELDEVTKKVLTRWIDRTTKDEKEREIQLKDLKEGLGFSPLTGSIVAIGVYDLEREQGAVYYISDNEEEEEFGAYLLKPRNEEAMLHDFWEGAKSYGTFVTFNGRAFDIPFINIKSAVYGIRPTLNLMQGRYLYQQRGPKHIDLQDQLTYYGAMMRRPSLHLFCRAFGIKSPKADGYAGDDVTKLFTEKKFRDIAQYNAGDVTATAELYKKWKAYLSS